MAESVPVAVNQSEKIHEDRVFAIENLDSFIVNLVACPEKRREKASFYLPAIILVTDCLFWLTQGFANQQFLIDLASNFEWQFVKEIYFSSEGILPDNSC
jgi:hypothetical protein